MSFRLVPKSVTLMTSNSVMAVTLRYFTEFGKHTFQHITAASSCGGILCTSLLYFVSRVRCRRIESSRSLCYQPVDRVTSVNAGCYITVCCSIFFYADNIILIAPTVCRLQAIRDF